MNKEIVKSERLGESYSVFHHPSGLDVLVWKMEGFTTTEAIFATKYGSIYNCFKTKDSKDFITVPEGIAIFLSISFLKTRTQMFLTYMQKLVPTQTLSRLLMKRHIRSVARKTGRILLKYFLTLFRSHILQSNLWLRSRE